MVLCFGQVAERLLVTHNVLAVAGIALALHQGSPSVSRIGAGNSLGRCTARRVHQNWPKGYSIPYIVMLSNKN